MAVANATAYTALATAAAAAAAVANGDCGIAAAAAATASATASAASNVRPTVLPNARRCMKHVLSDLGKLEDTAVLTTKSL